MKQSIFLTSGIILLVMTIAIIFLTIRARQTIDQIRQTRTEQGAMSSKIATLQDSQKKLTQVKGQLETYKTNLPSESEAMDYLKSEAQKQNLSATVTTLPSSVTAAAGTIGREGLFQITLTNGSTAAIQSYITALEQGTRHVTIKRATLTNPLASTNTQATLELSMGIK